MAAATAALVSLQYVNELKAIGQKLLAERSRLFESLKAVPFLHPYPTHANFILCQVEGRDAAQLKRDLATKGILVRYFNKPGLRDHIRISVGRPSDTDVLISALKKL